MSNALVNKAIGTIQLVEHEHRVDSRAVADMFGKQHDNILRATGNLRRNLNDIDGLIFESVEIADFSGKVKISHYLINRKGFMLLVMGFTGAKALAMKCAYIDAFDEMERRLSALQPSFDPAAYITGLIKENAALKAQAGGKPSLAAPEGMELVPTIELLFRKAGAIQSFMKDSEAAFVDSVHNQYQSRKDLSPKQRAVLNEIVGRVERRAARV